MAKKYSFWDTFLVRKNRHKTTVCRFITTKFNPPLPVEWVRQMGFHPDNIKWFIEPDTYGKNIVNGCYENIVASDLGTVVDTLTRFALTKEVEHTLTFIGQGLAHVAGFIWYWSNRPNFKVRDKRYPSIEAYEAQYYNDSIVYRQLIKEMYGGTISTGVVEKLTYLIPYNNVFRAGIKAYKPGIVPNEETVKNIKEMVLRSVRFLRQYSNNRIQCCVNFEKRSFGKTKWISAGDGDYATDTCLIDMKVKKDTELWSYAIYQIIIYYLLKQHEGVYYKKLMIFNPRWGWYYECETKNIPRDIIRTIKLYW